MMSWINKLQEMTDATVNEEKIINFNSNKISSSMYKGELPKDFSYSFYYATDDAPSYSSCLINIEGDSASLHVNGAYDDVFNVLASKNIITNDFKENVSACNLMVFNKCLSAEEIKVLFEHLSINSPKKYL